MGRFVTRFFAVIGFIVTLLMVTGGYIGMHAFKHAARPTAPESMILTLDFSKPLTEQDNTSPLSFALQLDAESTSLFDVLRALERAKDDTHVKAVVARFGSSQPSFAHGQEIRAALQKLAAAGKLSYAFAPSYGDFGMGNHAYFLASAFKEIWLQPVGSVGLTDLGFEVPFGKTALGNLGVSADFLQREEYKSAMENFTRDGFSPAAREDLVLMLKDINEQQAQGISEGRNWDIATVKDLMARGPYTATEALQHKLVTRLGYEDEMLEEVQKEVGKETKQIDVETYLDATEKNQPSKAKVALITGEGMITDQPSGARHLAEDNVIDADILASAFRDAADDKNVKAILFRIDSPGGSPVASETIRHALIRAKAAGKPVFVSMGSVAASGGYWIAMDADHIVANPSTLTGSIGVVAGKFITNGLWEKLGVKWERLENSENAHLWSTLEPYSVQGRERMNALVDETYQAFISNVAAARKIPLEKMPDIAKGRVWTGQQALKIGLIDELGGIETAIQAVKKNLKLQPNDPIELQSFPESESTSAALMKMLKGMGASGVALRDFLSFWQGFSAQTNGLKASFALKRPISSQLPETIEHSVR